MDQELVQYLDNRFQTLEQRLDQRFDRVGQRLADHDQRFESMDQRFETMDQQFESIDRKFGSIDRRFDSTDGRFESIDTQFQGLRAEVNERFDDVKRHTGILVEGLRHELHVVAEGLTMHIQVQDAREREYHDQQHRETRTLIRSVYDELKQQNAGLRERVENLERQRPS